MMQIRDLRGLGEKTEETLAKVDVHSLKELQNIGAIRVFLSLKEAGLKPSLNFLYALVGALQNRSWLDIAQNEKGKLLMEMEGYQELERLLEEEGKKIY